MFKSVLELIFSIDIGDGHLENYQVEDNHIEEKLDLFDSSLSICNKTEKAGVNCLVLKNKNITGYEHPAISKCRFNIGCMERGPPL